MDYAFEPGDIIRVETKFSAADAKEKAATFEGVVLGIRGRNENKSFTIRKIGAGGIGVERIFPYHSPHIVKITVKRKGDVRRAKLNYLRERVSKRALMA